MAYTPDQTTSYEALVQHYAMMAGAKIRTCPATVTIYAYHPIPASKSKKWKEAAAAGDFRVQSKPDADNIGKIICDALNSVAFEDDKQVYDLRIVKLYSNEPRVDVRIDYEDGAE